MNSKQHLYKLMGGIFQQVRKILDKQFAEIGLSRNEWLVLAMLRLSLDGVSQSEALKYTGVEKSYLSKVLNSLEDKGYIIREIDPVNRRNRIIKPNPKASKQLKVVFNMIHQLTEDSQQELSDREVETLYKLLAKVQIQVDQM